MSAANRHVDLWLSDFPTDPHEIAASLPMRPYLIARKGVLTGLRQLPARRNIMIFRYDFTHTASWTEAIEALIRSLGDWDEVGRLCDRLGCIERMVQFTLPITNSPHQENNFVETATLGRLAQHRIDLGMSFDEYRPDETDRS